MASVDIRPVEPTACDVRPLRADARRNRARILKAASAVFADRGQDAQMDEVAKRAKVGVGTLYRHFPTKEALLDALMRERFEQLTVWAREALDEPDAWAAFTAFLWRAAEVHASDRALAEGLAEAKMRAADQAVEMQACVSELMRRAQAAGQMRADARTDDIGVVMCGLGSVMNLRHFAPGSWQRYLTLMLDGLRPPMAAPSLPGSASISS